MSELSESPRHVSCDVAFDFLPEYHAGLLSSADRESMDQHLLQCNACRAALDAVGLAQRARPLVAAASATRIDAIVAALPAPPRPMSPTLHTVAAVRSAAPPSASGRTSWRVRAGSLRVAATLALVLTGTVSVGVWQQRSVSDAVPLSDTPVVVSTAVSTDAFADAVADAFAVAEQSATSIAPAVIPMQALGELTDAEIEQLLAHIEAWDGVPSDGLSPVLNIGTGTASDMPNAADRLDTVSGSTDRTQGVSR